jgi:hypothetical protein
VIAAVRIRWLTRLVPLLALAAALVLPMQGLAAPALLSASGCQFVLGFRALHDLDPGDTGDCTENQSFQPNGDATQRTTKGLMVWRKADNWTAFTNGSTTWINGPKGLVSRANGDRFPWEGATIPATSPTPTPKPLFAWTYKRVTDPPIALCGLGWSYPCADSEPNEGTQYISGHIFKKDGTAATNMTVQARIRGVNGVLSSGTGDDGMFGITFAVNCPPGPIVMDVYIVDADFKLSSYTNHITYTNCREAGEFHFDFMELPTPQQ